MHGSKRSPSTAITSTSSRIRPLVGMGGDKLLPKVAGIAEDSPAGQEVGKRRGEIFRTNYLPHIQAFPRK